MCSYTSVTIKTEWDIVGARQLGREIAKQVGFGVVDQARIATAISELARNIYLYAGTGEIELNIIEQEDRKGIRVTARDNGPGINNIMQVLEDGYTTSRGLGAGLPGVKRLMDDFDIQSNLGDGTTIEVIKWIDK